MSSGSIQSSRFESLENSQIPSPPISTAVPIVPTPPANATPTLGQTTLREKADIKKNPIQYYVKASFMITYILLLTTATITFIEAMRTDIPGVRHILNLETCISVVAGYFYSVFLAQIDGYIKEDVPVDWTDITKTRYIDWTITTPLMLFVLCIVLGINIDKKLPLHIIVMVIALNYTMLYTGYLGETKALSRPVATGAGFTAFAAMFYTIYREFIAPKYVFENNCMFFFFFIVWALYGIVYLLPETYKNIAMNVLDCISKCLVGLGLWVYYSKTISY
jgi:bacteriorhodopsin